MPGTGDRGEDGTGPRLWSPLVMPLLGAGRFPGVTPQLGQLLQSTDLFVQNWLF